MTIERITDITETDEVIRDEALPAMSALIVNLVSTLKGVEVIKGDSELEDLKEVLEEDREGREGEYNPQPVTYVEPVQIWDLSDGTAILNPRDLVGGEE